MTGWIQEKQRKLRIRPKEFKPCISKIRGRRSGHTLVRLLTPAFTLVSYIFGGTECFHLQGETRNKGNRFL